MPSRRLTGIQIRVPSRFRFPTVDSGFHLQDLVRCGRGKSREGAWATWARVGQDDVVDLARQLGPRRVSAQEQMKI
jgi:hypothetical protein